MATSWKIIVGPADNSEKISLTEAEMRRVLKARRSFNSSEELDAFLKETAPPPLILRPARIVQPELIPRPIPLFT